MCAKISDFGLDEHERLLMMDQLLYGTSTFFSKNLKSLKIDEMIQKVTSKGGTTEAGLLCYDKNDISQQILKMIEKSADIGRSLSTENNF